MTVNQARDLLGRCDTEMRYASWDNHITDNPQRFALYADIVEFLGGVKQGETVQELESAYQRGYLDGIGRECPDCKDYKSMYIKVRDELAAEQQRSQS